MLVYPRPLFTKVVPLSLLRNSSRPTSCPHWEGICTSGTGRRAAGRSISLCLEPQGSTTPSRASLWYVRLLFSTSCAIRNSIATTVADKVEIKCRQLKSLSPFLSLPSFLHSPPLPPLSLSLSQASKDIVRVAEWKDVECFTGNQYKKFYRAPGPYCFSLVVRAKFKILICEMSSIGVLYIGTRTELVLGHFNPPY